MARKGARRLHRPRYAGRVLVTSWCGIWIYLTVRTRSRHGEIQNKQQGSGPPRGFLCNSIPHSLRFVYINFSAKFCAPPAPRLRPVQWGGTPQNGGENCRKRAGRRLPDGTKAAKRRKNCGRLTPPAPFPVISGTAPHSPSPAAAAQGSPVCRSPSRREGPSCR